MIVLQYSVGACFAGSLPIKEAVLALGLSLIVPVGDAFCLAPQAARQEAADRPVNGLPLDQRKFADIAKLIDDGSLLLARSRVEALLASSPQNWRGALLAGRLYRKMGLSGFAIMQYEKVRAQDPRMVEALVALSELHLENLSTEIAIILARQAVEIDPHNKQARLALMEALLAGQSLRQAREQGQILTSMYPADADVAHTLSGLAQALGQYSEATSLLLSALAARPQKLTWRLELADTYQARGQYEACCTTLNKVLAVDPHSIEALNKMAHLQEFDMHDYMAALRFYRAIKELIVDSAAAQAGIDRCLAKQSDFALNTRNAVYHLFGINIRDAKRDDSNDLPSSL